MKTIDELWKLLKNVELVQIHPPEIEAIYNHCFEFINPFIVEVGSAHGASSIILAEAAKELGGQLICVDPFPEDYDGAAPGKFGTYAKKAFQKNVLKNYSSVIWYDTDSSEAVKKINDKFGPVINIIDVLFIDGDHSFDGVNNDLFNLGKNIKKGGYIAFHDHNNVAFEGVRRAAENYCSGWEKVDVIWDLAVYRKV